MKSVTILMAAVVIAAAPGAQAAGVVWKAHVPFGFGFAEQQLPSGEYKLIQEPDSRLLRIYSKDGQALALTTWTPLQANAQGRGTLVFHRYGDRYFLRMIRPAAGTGALVPETPRERQVRASGSPTHVALLK